MVESAWGNGPGVTLAMAACERALRQASVETV